jgi:hypothetical protein
MSGVNASKTAKTEPKTGRAPAAERPRQPTLADPQADILALQDAAGNQAVENLLRSGSVQAKLIISEPGDKYEQEADRVAKTVMETTDHTRPQNLDDIDKEKGIPALSNHAGDVPDNVSKLIESTHSQPLDTATRNFMESRFGGYDFSQVRLHTDEQAAEAAHALQARAFTLRNDIVFGAGQYAPGTTEGKRLLAHELAHVAQRTSSSDAGSGSATGRQDTVVQRASVEPTSPPHTLCAKGKAAATESRTRVENAEAIAWEFHSIAESASSLDQFKAQVEAKAASSLGLLGADAVVFSLSFAAGYWGGVGGGFEALYSPHFDWATFIQAGGGVISPGAGVALEVGIVWDVKNPKDYQGAFFEAAVTGGPGVIGPYPGMASISGTATPEDIADLVTKGTMSRPRGVKVGGGYGTPGVQGSVLFEWYWMLSGSAPEQESAQADEKVAAQHLIKRHTGRIGLDEEALGREALDQLPDQSGLVGQVLDSLSSTDRDDVSLEILRAASDEKIEAISQDQDGNALLLRMVRELQEGPTFSDERKQMRRVLNILAETHIAEDRSEKEPVIEVEVVTFYRGDLDFAGQYIGVTGHTSINVGGMNFNFAEDWGCGLTREEYLKENEWRAGVGQVLDVPSEDALRLQKKLIEACSTGIWGVGRDVCTTKTGQMLDEVLSGISPGRDPSAFERQLASPLTALSKSHN